MYAPTSGPCISCTICLEYCLPPHTTMSHFLQIFAYMTPFVVVFNTASLPTLFPLNRSTSPDILIKIEVVLTEEFEGYLHTKRTLLLHVSESVCMSDTPAPLMFSRSPEKETKFLHLNSSPRLSHYLPNLLPSHCSVPFFSFARAVVGKS